MCLGVCVCARVGVCVSGLWLFGHVRGTEHYCAGRQPEKLCGQRNEHLSLVTPALSANFHTPSVLSLPQSLSPSSTFSYPSLPLSPTLCLPHSPPLPLSQSLLPHCPSLLLPMMHLFHPTSFFPFLFITLSWITPPPFFLSSSPQ